MRKVSCKRTSTPLNGGNFLEKTLRKTRLSPQIRRATLTFWGPDSLEFEISVKIHP